MRRDLPGGMYSMAPISTPRACPTKSTSGFCSFTGNPLAAGYHGEVGSFQSRVVRAHIPFIHARLTTLFDGLLVLQNLCCIAVGDGGKGIGPVPRTVYKPLLVAIFWIYPTPIARTCCGSSTVCLSMWLPLMSSLPE